MFWDYSIFNTRLIINLSKAFQTIHHSIIFNKLRYYGLDGSTVNLFKSYLSNRSQYVEFENACVRACVHVFVKCRRSRVFA